MFWYMVAHLFYHFHGDSKYAQRKRLSFSAARWCVMIGTSNYTKFSQIWLSLSALVLKRIKPTVSFLVKKKKSHKMVFVH